MNRKLAIFSAELIGLVFLCFLVFNPRSLVDGGVNPSTRPSPSPSCCPLDHCYEKCTSPVPCQCYCCKAMRTSPEVCDNNYRYTTGHCPSPSPSPSRRPSPSRSPSPSQSPSPSPLTCAQLNEGDPCSDGPIACTGDFACHRSICSCHNTSPCLEEWGICTMAGGLVCQFTALMRGIGCYTDDGTFGRCDGNGNCVTPTPTP